MKNIAEFIWEKHQSHWNWIIMVSTFIVLLMALWWHSIILFLVTVAGVVASLWELPDPIPPFARIEKILGYERKWLRKPWGWEKSLQTFGIVAAVIYVFISCWNASIMALLLLIGICVNIGCVYGNKAMGIDDV